MTNQESLGLDEFLGYKTSGSKSSFLKKWTTSRDHQLNMVLMTHDSIWPLWRHPFPRIVTLEKDSTVEVWGGSYVCWEDKEPTLLKQYQRKDDGSRKYPPVRCGACKMIEWVHQQIIAEKIAWTDELFRFEGDDADKTRVLHAGGITGLFMSNKLDDDEKKDLKSNGIRVKDSWMEKMSAQANFMFAIVDFDDPKAGVQITIEKASLGNKIQIEIADQIKSLGQKGNPFKHPYVIQCEYNPADNIPFGDKYQARAMMGDDWKITPDILELVNGQGPDVDHITSRFNATELRMSLESHALIKMPWDEWFGPLDQKEVDKLKDKEANKKDSKREDSGKSQQKRQDTQRRTDPAPPPPPPAEDDDDLEQCAKCDDGMLKPTDDICSACQWNHATNVYEKPPEQKRRRRGEAVEEPKKAEGKAKVDAKPKGKDKSPFADDDGDVPF